MGTENLTSLKTCCQNSKTRNFRYCRFRQQIGKGIFKDKKRKAAERERRRRKENTSWNLKLEDRVLIKGQNQSDFAKVVIDKFIHVYQASMKYDFI